MGLIWSPLRIYQIQQYRSQEDTGTQVIKATEFKYELRSDLGFKKPDFKKPDFKKPDFKKPNFKKHNFKKQTLRNPMLRNLTKKPDTKKPE